MKRLSMAFFISTGLLWAGAHAQAMEIYSDTFTGVDGDLLTDRAPEVNNGVAGVLYEGPTTVWPRDIQGNRARLGADTYANIDITSSGAYVRPQVIRISAIMDMGSTTGPTTPDGLEPTRGIGLGFYAGVGDNIFVNTDFRGLILTTDGRLVLGRTGENGSARVGTVETIASGLDNSGQHTLSFEIDTVTGDISNILLDDNPQTDISTTLFAADVNRAGFFTSSAGGGTSAFFDDFSVSAAGTPQLPGDTDGDGDIDDADLGTSFSNFTGPVGAVGGKNASQGDTDGDGDVDDADLANSFSGFTGPQAPASVPEPASPALLGLGGLMFARRRR